MHFVVGEVFWRCQIQLIDGAFQFNGILNFCLLNLSIAEKKEVDISNYNSASCNSDSFSLDYFDTLFGAVTLRIFMSS